MDTLPCVAKDRHHQTITLEMKEELEVAQEAGKTTATWYT
jgi:hypothetical protein